MVEPRFKFDVHIPIAIVFAMIVQTIAFVHFGSQWMADVDNRIANLENAQLEAINREKRIRQLENNVGRIEERLKSIDGTTQRIERKLDKISYRLQTGGKNVNVFSLSLSELTEVTV